VCRFICDFLAGEVEVSHMHPISGECRVALPEILVVAMPIGWPEGELREKSIGVGAIS